MENKVAIVTGVSSGMGKEIAFELKRRGFKVYGGARRLERMKDLQNQGINIQYLDITDDDSIVAFVNNIQNKEGRIDVLVNNAGYGSLGAVEDIDIEEVRHQFEVNVFGLGRITQLVLPIMRKRRSGKIINTSSMGGMVTTPYGGWYYASKYAVEGYSDSLRKELTPFGIDVILIEPGIIKSEWNIIATDNLKKTLTDSAYKEEASVYADKLKGMYIKSSASSPKYIAQIIGKAASSNKPKTRYLCGYMAKESILLCRLLGDKNYDKLIKKIMC